ncbi:VOC family protein [Pseudonocardia sp.]|uniref:VOC family protein n=1 Tax=Pseudonocardia sp. TaxID=60912 RepID=UPI00261F1A9D|nr:VOC family protein [Pseudonocardia sp.]
MNTPRLGVTGLDHVALSVPDLRAALDFYVEHWGLVEVAEDRGRHHLATGQARFAALVLSAGPVLALDHLAFGVASAEALDGLASRLTEAGHPCARVEPGALEPGQTHVVRTQDPDGNTVELVVGPAATVERPAVDRVTPLKLGHVVLGTPDQRAAEMFYALLGFRTTDRTAPGMWFLRCNADHHTLALVPAQRPWLQHMAYDVGTVDEVMRGMGALRAAGSAPIWGPGRHGPGNNVFTYYEDPAGMIIEYYGELEQFSELDLDAEIPVKDWGPEHKGDRWGIAGRPPASFTSAPTAAGER